MIEQKEQTAVEMFGVPIYFFNETFRLRDIQAAYMAETGTTDSATRPSKWLERSATKDLIDFLDSSDDFYSPESGSVKSIDTPRGDRGGLYACRELAYSYAMWLDPRFAAYVLRAFDQIVNGDLFGAKASANNVAKRFIRESYKSRFERLTALGIDYKSYMAVVLSDVLEFAPREDLTEFLDQITTECPTSASVLHEMLCGAEIAVLQGGDLDDAVRNALELYENDSRISTLKTFVENFNK